MLAKIYRKYHPQEHDLFDAVDDDYMKRFDKVFGVKAAKRHKESWYARKCEYAKANSDYEN